MSKMKQNGGAAFPRPIGQVAPAAGGKFNAAQDGMSLRDYFAARAPERIEEWFVYVHPTQRPALLFAHLELDAEEQRQFEGLGDWINPEDVSEKVRDFAARANAAHEAAEAYDRGRSRARYCAWRYAYADAMLEAREAAADAPSAPRQPSNGEDLLTWCHAYETVLERTLAAADDQREVAKLEGKTSPENEASYALARAPLARKLAALRDSIRTAEAGMRGDAGKGQVAPRELDGDKPCE